VSYLIELLFFVHRAPWQQCNKSLATGVLSSDSTE